MNVDLIASFIEKNIYLIITLFIVIIYIIIAKILSSRFKSKLKRRGMSFWGPFFLWRTARGIKFINWLAKRKVFWRIYANISIVILFLAMFFMVVTLILGAYFITILPTRPTPPENLLVLPGINPIIPLWYGLISLIVAVVIHEFAHGILARVANINIKSLGVVLFVIPIGAFVEPDAEHLQNAEKIKRNRVFAAGPATNIIFGLICAMIFAWSFMGSLEPVEDGALILDVTEDNPAEISGIRPGMIIVHIEGNTSDGSYLPGVSVNDRDDFSDFMENTHANDTLNITVFKSGKYITISNITLEDKGEYYRQIPGAEEFYSEFLGKGFLGVSTVGSREFIESLAHPVQSADGDRNKIIGNILYFSVELPLNYKAGIMPFQEPLTDVYEITGSLGAMPEGMFWFLANLFYYLFWINILVGIFNALPAVPLDGGYPFRDAWDTILKRIPRYKDTERREIVVNKITFWTAMLILFLLMWTILITYLK
jgi:membrane-associated protease RseP (regulator of RpoE activity)